MCLICLIDGVSIDQEEIKVVSIDGYTDVDETDSALLCAAAQQPISVGMDGSALDFQLYTGVSISSLPYGFKSYNSCPEFW